jgi:hypothetical protein
LAGLDASDQVAEFIELAMVLRFRRVSVLCQAFDAEHPLRDGKVFGRRPWGSR